MAQDLDCDRALTGYYIGVVVRMNKCRSLRFLELERMGIRVAERVAAQHDLRSARFDRLDLDRGRRDRHHDRRLAGELLRRKRHALRVIPRRRGDDTARTLGGRKLGHLVIRATQLE